MSGPRSRCPLTPRSGARRVGLLRAPGRRHPAGVPADRRHGARRPAPDRARPAPGAHAGGGPRAGRPLPQPAGAVTVSNPCRGLLFDADGVLVDFDASVLQSWSRWAHRWDLDPDDVAAMVHGRRSADTVALLIDHADRARALADIDRLAAAGLPRPTVLVCADDVATGKP